MVQGQSNRLIYARGQLGPGNTFPLGLPYILGDKDPKDPVNGWEDLGVFEGAQQLHRVLPDGHRRDDEELGEGSRDMTVTMTGGTSIRVCSASCRRSSRSRRSRE